ncbi:MAG: hypothetical protein V8Q42_09045 [Anaerovoracaceae bacterium]
MHGRVIPRPVPVRRGGGYFDEAAAPAANSMLPSEKKTARKKMVKVKAVSGDTGYIEQELEKTDRMQDGRSSIFLT